MCSWPVCALVEAPRTDDRDPKDDPVLEWAVAGNGEGIVTFNARDFAGVERFGLWIMTPREFLARIGEIG
jgi:predicted nucleic acid-binding protein